jgi:large repetitive protein
MKKNLVNYKWTFVFTLFFVSTNFVQAQNFEDKTVDAIVTTPVRLISFSAAKSNNDIIITWKTASEINNSHFIIERSTNGVDFTSIAQIVGRGNSNIVNDYSFTDVNTPKLNLYYRLQQVDFNADKSYSIIVLVKTFKDAQPTISIYPNPVQQRIASITTSNIASGKYILSIKSLDGKHILHNVESIIATNQVFQLLLPEAIPSGIYLLQITNNVSTVNLSQKLVLQ